MKRRIHKKHSPEILRKEVCGFCNAPRNRFCHDKDTEQYDHAYYPVLETLAEAAYRQGYEDGYRKAEDRAHWGLGWD